MKKRGLEGKFRYINKNNRNSYRYIVIFSVLLTLNLCSCQNRPKMIIYMGPSAGQNVTGDLYVENKNYQEVLEKCQDRLQNFAEDSIEAADLYGKMGGVYAEYTEEREMAEFYINKAINIHQKQGDEIGLALDYTDMSKIYLYMDDAPEDGLGYLEKAEQLYKKHGMDYAFGLAGVFVNKGHIFLKANRYEEAIEAFNQAQDIYKKRNEQNITIYMLKGKTFLKMQEYDFAEEQYLEAKRISQELNEEYDIARVEFQLGWLYTSMSKSNQAIVHYTQALEIYSKNENFIINTAKTYNNMALSYDQLKEIEKALELSIESCRTIEKVTPATNESIEDKKIYKHNLSLYYKDWSKDMSEEGFEAWYQRVVLEEEDWKV